MIREIEQDVRETSLYLEQEVLSDAVLRALRTVPRHRFVPADQLEWAYENRPLPIGFGQTISQPYIVAIMTDLLKLRPAHRVLEIGTGSGYQAAILSEIVDQVYTIEIVEGLAESARERIQSLGYKRIHTRTGDGYFGWESEAPFDAIVVTAAASHVPPPLVQQLKPGGRMIIPVGSRFMVQQLLLVQKDLEGLVTTRQILPVRFVPLIGNHS
jgi:protein-L-isoaspartate(D-aspartate) O-methyltransferase